MRRRWEPDPKWLGDPGQKRGRWVQTVDDTTDCMCRQYGSYVTNASVSYAPDRQTGHGTIPRYMLTEARAERIIREWCDKATENHGPRCSQRFHGASECDCGVADGHRFEPVFSGDPRGACVKLRVPSSKSDSWDGEGVCVPTRRY